MQPSPLLIGNDLPLYREVLMGALRALRPDLDALVVAPDELDAAVRRLRPWLVICSAVTRVIEGDVPAWILLHPANDPHTTVSVAGTRREIPHPSLDELLELIDEVRAATPLTACAD